MEGVALYRRSMAGGREFHGSYGESGHGRASSSETNPIFGKEPKICVERGSDSLSEFEETNGGDSDSDGDDDRLVKAYYDLNPKEISIESVQLLLDLLENR